MPWQLEMDSVYGTDLGADAALLAKHLQIRGLSINQTHDLGRASSDAHTTAIALERIDYWEHFLTLRITF